LRRKEKGETSMDWGQILAATLFNAVFTAGALTALGFVARSIIQRWIDKDLASHKAKLQAANDKELEKLRTELRLAAFRHELRFTKLHEKRLEVVAGLYEKLVDLDRAYWPETQFNLEKPSLKETVNAINEAGWEFWEYFDKHRIYFSSSLCGKLEDLRQKYVVVWRELKKSEVLPELGEKQQHWLNAKELIEQTIQLKTDIETEFRLLLGVTNDIDTGAE
jgi:hypothetical protein